MNPSWDDTTPVSDQPSWDNTQPVVAAPQKGPSPLFAAVDSYKSSVPYATSPMGMLEQVPGLLSRGAHKVGEFVAGQLVKPQPIRVPSFVPGIGGKVYDSGSMNPTAAAAIGTAISMGPDVAMATSSPTESAPESAAASDQAPGFLQSLGARGVNNAAGITPKTILRMAGGQNPAAVGTRLGTSLVNEGAIGTTPASTFDNAQRVMNAYGSDVQSALDAIRSSGQPTTFEAKDALQSLLDEAQSLRNSTFQPNRQMARPYEEAYSRLSGLADQNGGQISLDDLRNVLQETGQAMDAAAAGSTKQAAYSRLYGHLADMRDQMVQNIADNAGNPALRDALLKANEGYSRYSRIFPDIQRNAAKESVSGVSIVEPVKGALRSVQPFLSRLAVRVGQPSISTPAAPLGVAAEEGSTEGAPTAPGPSNVAPMPGLTPAAMDRLKRIAMRVSGVGPPPIPAEGTPVMMAPAPEPRPINFNPKRIARVIGPTEEILNRNKRRPIFRKAS